MHHLKSIPAQYKTTLAVALNARHSLSVAGENPLTPSEIHFILHTKFSTKVKIKFPKAKRNLDRVLLAEGRASYRQSSGIRQQKREAYTAWH